MIAYSVMMFAAAFLFFGLAVAIYRGNTHLIHDYHQTHVKEADKREYGKSFSKGLFALAAFLVFSGIAALFGAAIPAVIISAGFEFAGIVIAFIIMAKAQKEWNGGF